MMLKDLSSESWHSLSSHQAIDFFKSNASVGLTDEVIKERSEFFGKNNLPKYKPISLMARLTNQLKNPLVLVLIFAGILTFILKDYLDSAVIFSVVLINAIIGLIQEGKAENALTAVNSLLSEKATVIRNGRKNIIAAQDLVPGDVVLLESGSKVPADLRLVTTQNLRVDESALTGESVAREKSTDEVSSNAVIADRTSLVFAGTLVVSGTAKGLVIATGLKTQIGKISELVGKSDSLTTPLTKRLENFAKQITMFILILGLIVFFYTTYLINLPQLEAFLLVVGIAVAAIPEGLPAIITIVLAIGTRAMAMNNAIVRRLPAVETLGSVTVICTDKTGTLTKNEMTAVNIVTAKSKVFVTGVGYEPFGDFLIENSKIVPGELEDINKLTLAAALCNEAVLKQDSKNNWQIIGDPTEAALLTLAKKAQLSPEKANGDWMRVDQIPFESENRFMATLNKANSGENYIFVKGAPEKILELCHLSKDQYWLDQIAQAGNEGQRILAFASIEVANDFAELSLGSLPDYFEMIGLVGFIDPPRQDAIYAVAECRKAGIKVKMITGDHAATATSIAKQLGIESTTALTGQEIESMTEAQLLQAIQNHDVIARANPEHKMRIVLALQKLGNYVAMTGDGVNDAPALKAADIGIAMGKRGTDAARDASDLILTDDNFATIERAVERGRVVFDNIKKSFLFMLPTNGGETGLILSALILGLTMPLTVAQILWVNMVTTVTLDFSLAYEKAEKDTMKRLPRPPTEPLITRPLLLRIIFVSILMTLITLFAFQWELNSGSSVEIARTTALNVLVFTEIFYLVSVRHFTKSSLRLGAFFENKVMIMVIGLLIVMQLGITYLPMLNQIFNTNPLDLWSWIMILGLSISMFIVIEIEKAISRNKKSNKVTKYFKH